MTKVVLGAVILASGIALVVFADPGLKLAWWQVGDYPQYPPAAAPPIGRTVEEIDSTRAYLKRLALEERRRERVRVKRGVWQTRKDMIVDARLGTAKGALSLFVLYWWVLGLLGALFDTGKWLKKRRQGRIR